MTIKLKISLFISTLFTMLYGMSCLVIILLFSNFRKQEFKQRLEEKAMESITLLVSIKEVDQGILRLIDKNSINQLYNEKTLIFDDHYKLIYSSLDDTKIKYTNEDLDYLKEHKTFFNRDGDYEIYGVYYEDGAKSYYALISAHDTYGHSKLNYLISLVIGVYIIFTFVAWILCFYSTDRLLRPLYHFHSSISKINENNLQSRLPVNNESRNEVNLMAREFNHLMSRIEQAYNKQKEFTAQASHELRTPLARISAQLENLLSNTRKEDQGIVMSSLQNVRQLNQLINSLLLLSKADIGLQRPNEKCRIDEAIYKSIEKVHLEVKEFKAILNMEPEDITEESLELSYDPNLLEIIFYNLLKNAANYSLNKQATVDIVSAEKTVRVVISNNGNCLSEEERKRLFDPFMRGSNSKNTQGLGLGLRIVSRIMNTHGDTISYGCENDINHFYLLFHRI